MKETSDTFSARMQLQIIQNLELSIHNIHIVYEDKTTKPNHPFAFGITLNSITFQVEINFQKLLSFPPIF
jgi:vacuolar protein sorting-associated protein 13A/C